MMNVKSCVMKANKEKFFKDTDVKDVKNFSSNKSIEEERDIITDRNKVNNNFNGKWYEKNKFFGNIEATSLPPEDVQNLKKQAAFIFNEAVVLNKSKAPKSLSSSEYAWVRTVMSKGTKTDKVAAYTLYIQDSPIYNLNLLKNMVDMVKVGKNKECFMAVDTLCELFLKDLLPPDRKLLLFKDQPLSKLDEITSGNKITKNKILLLWYFEDQLKSIYADFVNLLTKIGYDSVEANKQKVISAMYKLLEGNSEMETLLLNSIVNKLGDPSRKVGSKVIYVLMKLLQTHPNMKEVVASAVEKVIFRSNISRRAQYYSICFLSQFCLFNRDTKVAKKLITIYLSLFKACIKTGDIDSRMMSALLAGVNRAFPYLKEDFAMIQDHMNTLYKIIHLSQPNIAIQALSLVHLMSTDSDISVGRFYSVLYKKIGEIEMFQSTHHAMLINLIFKALKKDNEKSRICAFIKRLFQVCAHIPTAVACGVLIMIAQVIKRKGDVMLTESIPEDTNAIKVEEDSDDDGEEHYEDVKEDNDSSNKDSTLNETSESSSKPASSMYNVAVPETFKVWSNLNKSQEGARPIEIQHYDPFVRNPMYAGALKSMYYELIELAQHFHPTVSLFAHKIIRGEAINYSGDPFLDFTLMHFLDKFAFKNPKAIKPEEERNMSFDKFNRKKYYSSSPIRRLRANTVEYLKLSETSIPADEIFLYKYMKEKAQLNPIAKKKDDSDVESVGSDEFDDLMTGIIDGKKDEIDFLNEVGQLPKKDKKMKNKKDEEDMIIEQDESEDGDLNEDFDGSDGGESLAEDFDGDEMDDFSVDGEEFEDCDVDEDEAELEASGFKLPDLSSFKKDKKKIKKKGKGDFKDSFFASAEEFAEILEEADGNDGTSETLSNKDRAAAKQLKWEMDRDKWINKKKFGNKGIKRFYSGEKYKGNSKGVKRKRF